MRLGDYVRMSTANPTGWRPWNSRLGLGAFYLQNSYPLPTTGRGPFLLQPGVCDCRRPTVNGGMGIEFPNYPGIGARGSWITHGGYPAPVYAPPRQVKLSGLGRLGAARTAPHVAYRGTLITSATPSGTAVAQSNGSTSNATGTNWMAATNRGWNSIGQGRQGRGSQYGSSQYGNQYGSQYGNQNYTSTPATGGVSETAAGTITGYDASGNPIYSSAPAGATITGYDAQGNPIYGTAASSTSATGESWFAEDSLGLGLNNGIYLVGGVLAVWLLSSRGRR